jgi:transcriptional regulator with XRE-family HTH domain
MWVLPVGAPDVAVLLGDYAGGVDAGGGAERRAELGRLALGLRMRELRSGAGMTLAALAAASGVSLSYLSDIERGRRTPALDVLDQVCSALGLTAVAALVGVYPYGSQAAPAGLEPPPDGRSVTSTPPAAGQPGAVGSGGPAAAAQPGRAAPTMQVTQTAECVSRSMDPPLEGSGGSYHRWYVEFSVLTRQPIPRCA